MTYQGVDALALEETAPVVDPSTGHEVIGAYDSGPKMFIARLMELYFLDDQDRAWTRIDRFFSNGLKSDLMDQKIVTTVTGDTYTKWIDSVHRPVAASCNYTVGAHPLPAIPSWAYRDPRYGALMDGFSRECQAAGRAHWGDARQGQRDGAEEAEGRGGQRQG